MSASRPRTVYATAAQWARIVQRAEAAGMRASPFLVACSLHDETREQRVPVPRAEAKRDHRLVLTAREQREMHAGLVHLDECVRALMEHLPELGMSVFEALAFMQRHLQGEAEERERLVRMDGEYLP